MEDKLVINLKGIEKSYGLGKAATNVLRGVTLKVGKGESIALIGQSGSGKSTLLNIIGGLDKPDGGSVHVLGCDYAKISETKLADLRNEEIGFVFQAFNLLDHLSCMGNVALPALFARDLHGAKEIDERAMECLERVGLSDIADRTPGELSGGQKQRVAIARALFRRPALLLCDEPTGNLDSKTGQEVIEFFVKLNEEDGVTLVLVTHELRVSGAAKRMIQIRDGQIIEGNGICAVTGGVS